MWAASLYLVVQVNHTGGCESEGQVDMTGYDLSWVLLTVDLKILRIKIKILIMNTFGSL